jgi:hypothetical protein
MGRKFKIDGREYEAYELTNAELIRLLEDENTSTGDLLELTSVLKERFKYNMCPKADENNDDVFARFFSNFVNGKCNDKKKVAELMCKDHRYLQNEMFHICLEYIKQLAANYEEGWYDARNRYAAETSKKIIDMFKETNYPY